MLNEHIKKDAVIKLYHSKQDLDEYTNDERIRLCKGRIRKIVSESEIEIILEENAEKEFQKNICYIMYIFTVQDIFLCCCYYKSSFLEEDNKLLLMDIVSPLERVQRRMHHRVSCHSKILYRKLTPEEAKKQLEGAELLDGSELVMDTCENSLVDISGGGIRFTSKKQIFVDDYLCVRFEVMNEKHVVEMKVMGQVVCSKKLRNEEDGYDIRMKYIGLTEEAKKQIIYFVFQLERDNINVRWQRGGDFA